MPADFIRIGSIYKIPVELHWIFILLTLFFILLSPLFGLIWILLFVCAFIHEVSHAATARANGLSVKKIILTLWGGATVLENETLDPKVEFRVSIAGPIMSLFLGGIFGILTIITPPGIIEFLLQELFILNIFLGVFNLLPAFPMDGGRIFRSYLRKKHSEYDATKITVKASIIVLALIMVGTVALILIESDWSLIRKETFFILDLIVVYFLYGGAKAEEQMEEIRKQSGSLTIKNMLSKSFTLVKSEDKVGSLYKIIKGRKSHFILTTLPSSYGIVDIAKVAKLKKAVKIKDIALPIPSLKSNTKVADAILKMEGDGFGIAAVVSNGKLIGIVTSTQISAFVSLHILNKKDRK